MLKNNYFTSLLYLLFCYYAFLIMSVTSVMAMEQNPYFDPQKGYQIKNDARPWFDGKDYPIILEMYDEKPIGIQLPNTLIFEVSETEAVVKGQTAASSNKPAVLENGLRVMVPPFIEQGEKVIINTEDLTYLKRAE